MSDLPSLVSKSRSKNTFLRLRYFLCIASLVSFAGCTELYGPSRVGQIYDVALSNDARIIAVAGKRPRSNRNGLVEVYDLNAGRLIGKVKPKHGVWSVAVSPDGRRLAYNESGSPVVHVCNVSESLETVAALELPPGDGPILSSRQLHFSENGKYLYAVVECKHVSVWDAQTFQHIVNIYPRCPHSAAMSADEQWLAVGSCAGDIKVYSTNDWKEVYSLECNLRVSDIGFAPSGEFLAASAITCNQNSCTYLRRVWDIGTTKLVREFPAKWPSVVFDPTENRLALQNEENSITWLALPEFAVERVHFEGAGWLRASAGQPRVVVGNRYWENGEICVWSWDSIGNTRLLHTIQWHPWRVPWGKWNTALITEAHDQ